MTSIIDSFASYWYYFMFVSFGLGMIGLGFLFNWQYGNPENPTKQLKIGGILIGQLLLTWIIGFGSFSLVETRAKNELINILTNEHVNLTIIGKQLTQKDELELLNILKTIKHIPAHHSHPTEELIIQLKFDNHMSNIYLNMDSERKDEYWVYWDKYTVSNSNEIGRIKNGTLKKYGS